MDFHHPFVEIGAIRAMNNSNNSTGRCLEILQKQQQQLQATMLDKIFWSLWTFLLLKT